MNKKINTLAVLGIFVIGAWFSIDFGQALVAQDSLVAHAERICLVAQCGTDGGQLWQRVDGSQSGECRGFNYAPVMDPADAEFRSTDIGGFDVIDNCFLAGPSYYTSTYPTTPPASGLTCTLSATPASVISGNSSLLKWTSAGAVTCTGLNFSTSGATSNASGVSTGPLTNTTTYSMNCSTAAPVQTWQVQEEDYTDYWCEASGINDPNRNGLNRAYAHVPNCSSASPEGTACGSASGICKVNTGQCVIHTTIYQCGGSSEGSSSLPTVRTTQCSTTVTVNTPPPPPPPQPNRPLCELDLTKGAIDWSTTGANNVQIVPLTNSPQVPGATGGSGSGQSFTHSEADAYNSVAVQQDVQLYGISAGALSASGFASDQVTMNRVCTLLHGTGSTASAIGARSYNSPGNNTIVKYSGSLWSHIGARSYNSHLSSSFKCSGSTTPTTWPLSGLHNFVPPLPVGTHTYQLTATGPGGSTQCTKTITVALPPPPQPNRPLCELDLTKGAIDWSTTGANNVQIVPLTNSPQVPGATGGSGSGQSFTHSEADAYNSVAVQQDVQLYGISAGALSASGFASDQVTMNRVCTLLHGTGSTASAIGARSYNSPGNNTIVKYSGSLWSRIGARSYNSHLSGSFKCSGSTTPTTWPLSGSFNFVPPLSVGTHTYQLTATAPGGAQVQCTKTVVVPPLPPPHIGCKLEITKSVDNGEASPGDIIEYTINFKNVGNADCTGGGVKVIDVVDQGLTFIDEEHSSNVDGGYDSDPVYKSSDRTLRWNAYVLIPGEAGWVRWDAKANTPSACSVIIPNVAKITSYEYNHFQTWVTSNRVDVEVEKDCPHTTDVCPNINGVQTSVPAGKQLVNGQCVDIPLAPVCTLTISASSINTGGHVKISWTSTNATAGSINHNVGNVNPVSSGTSIDIFPPDDTTYTGTFTGPNGATTCTVFVDVRTGGGGCVAGTCPGGLNQPTVTLASLRSPGVAPLVASVYLSQIPYTGFEAGPALTMIFWIAIALFSALIAYFIAGQGGIRYLLAYVSDLAGVPSLKAVEERENEFGAVRPNGDVYGVAYPELETADRSGTQYLESVAAPVMVPVRPPATPMVPARVASAPVTTTPVKESDLPAQTGIPPLTSVIESRAHAAGVLISPEAVAAATKLSPDRADALVIFGDILNRAIQSIPRDDGWVMITSDRFETVRNDVMAKRKANGIAAPAPFNVEPIEMRTTAAPSTANDSAAGEFVGAILSGDRDTAFAIVRSLEKDHISPTSLMTGTAAVLDRIYRLRKGGKNGLDATLLEKSGKVDDAVISKLVEIFVHSLDQAYANPFTGVKLALAQAFETVG